MDRTLKVLVFPGFLQNAAIINAKLEPLRHHIGGRVEFIVVDPPHLLTMPTPSSPTMDSFLSPAISQSSEHAPRTWWHTCATSRESSTHYSNLPETLDYFAQILTVYGPIDGVFGFSQGSAAASLVAMLLGRPGAWEKVYGPRVPKPAYELKFGIFCSGFIPQEKRVKALYYEDEPLPLRSLHILGEADTVISNENTLALAEMFEDAEVDRHLGGHFIPSTLNWCRRFADFITPPSPVVEFDSAQIWYSNPVTPEQDAKSQQRRNSAVRLYRRRTVRGVVVATGRKGVTV
ncbi:hypothetical protein T439DRAFT_326270 [Meredithblackwellia eburnea MCA 4105]